jgi:putative phosphoesterase
MTADKKRAKLLVFSDSHGNSRYIAEIMRLHAAQTDFAIHLGDGTADMDILRELYKDIIFICVPGNLEERSGHARSPFLLRDICGVRLMMCHGHRHGVKYGNEYLIAAARREKADIVLYGHTHRSYQEYISAEQRELRLFCPGSISCPCDSPPSYGIIDIRENGILMTNAVFRT